MKKKHKEVGQLILLQTFLQELRSCGEIKWNFDEQQADPIHKFWRTEIPKWIKLIEKLKSQ